MYKHRNVISAVILTFVVTSIFYLTVGSNVLNFIGSLSGNSFSKINRAQNLIEKYYINDYDEQVMQDAALESYVASLGDKYADYISEEEFEDYQTMVSGDYSGIGVEVFIDDNGLITIQTVYENSPAEKNGLMTNDKLIKANGIDISADNYDEAIKTIKGVNDESDTVKLTVMRNNETFEKDITRESISIKYITEKMIDNVAYIRIASFEGHSAEQFKTAVDNAISNKAKGLVIDLRNNPGGTLDMVLEICDRIMSDGVILTIKSKTEKEQSFKADNDESLDLPICILVNQNTASAAEVMTGALKDHNIATVIGTKTFGKGVVQSIYFLGYNSALKFTTYKYYTPSGVCVNDIGITPDQIIELPEEFKNKSVASIPANKDTQLIKALEILK